MACMVGVLIGHSVYRYIDFRKHPELYAMQSAPWYTSIIVQGVVTIAIMAVCMIVILILRKKDKNGTL